MRELKQYRRYNLEGSEGSLTYVNPDDSRKPHLTLRHLNKMKKYKAMSDLEFLKKNEILTTMYGLPDDDTGGGDMF